MGPLDSYPLELQARIRPYISQPERQREPLNTLEGALKQDWSRDDVIRQTLFTSLLGIDRNQSMAIAKNPDSYYEATPWMPRQPSKGQINNITGATMIGHALLMNAVSPEWRKWLQRAGIGIEAATILANRRQ